ncbi:MAG: type II toxin-antitoxin system VapC family toxin [Deltaproteobacteria bacterium]|nr:type II toxin-antitoxin system VapC family toxin [Deltaproteobacteria bacterium]
MISVDTNVLVRYVTNDDPAQARRAAELLAGDDEVFVPKTVLLELAWVLRAVYRLPGESIRKALLHVLGLPNVHAETPEQVAVALEHYAQGLDFADALHLSSTPSADAFFTFDLAFATRARALGAPVEAL